MQKSFGFFRVMTAIAIAASMSVGMELIGADFTWTAGKWEGDGQAIVIANNPLTGTITANNGGGFFVLDKSGLLDWTNATSVSITYTSNRSLYIGFNDGQYGYAYTVAAGTNKTVNIPLLGTTFSYWDAETSSSKQKTMTKEILSAIQYFSIESDGDYMGQWGSPVQNNITITSISVAGLQEYTNLHTITATAQTGGSISPSGNVQVKDGGNITFVITPEKTYKIKEVKVNGTSIGAVSSYTFSNIIGDSTIDASFERLSFVELIGDDFTWSVGKYGDGNANITNNNPLTGTTTANKGGGTFNSNSFNIFNWAAATSAAIKYTSNRDFLFCLWDGVNSYNVTIAAGVNKTAEIFLLDANFNYWDDASQQQKTKKMTAEVLSAIQGFGIASEGDWYMVPVTNNITITSISVIGLQARASETVAVVWGTQTDFVYTGNQQAPSATAVTSNGISLPLTVFGAQTNAGSGYTATAALSTGNFNVNLTNTTKQFSISKASIAPVINISNVRAGNPLNPSVSGNPTGALPTYLYAASANGTYSASVPTAQGTYFAKAVIAETTNYLGAETQPVSFAIVSPTATDVAVVWGTQNEFVYDGDAKAPTATAVVLGISIPLNVRGEINAGEYTAIANLATPNNEIVLSNASKTFKITPKPLPEKSITPIEYVPFTGFQHTPDIVVKDGAKVLTQNLDYVVSYGANISGMGKVYINGIGNYKGTDSSSFAIASMGVSIATVVWSTTTEFEYDGTQQCPTATAKWNGTDVEIEIIGAQTNAGSHTAVAQLKNPELGVILVNLVRPYTIKPKTLPVTWTAERKFTYNKRVQVPIPSVSDASVDLRVVNGRSEAGSYTGVLAPFAQIVSANAGNYTLTNYSVDYEIIKKPLDVVMKKDGQIIDSLVVDKNAINDETALLNYLKSIVDYSGFASDENNIFDDASVLSGDKTFEFSKSTRSVENGDYIVKIKTDNITAKNYTVKEREIRVSVSDNGISFATPINKIQKSDGRYGIKFTSGNIVSQKAEFEVILPDNDKVQEVKAVIYDNTGNVVFTTTQRGANVSWNLTNAVGRNVANGTYLIVVEAKGAKGNYAYSAKVGVKR